MRMRIPMLVVLLCAAATAQSKYTRTDHMIPMRDGVRLHTQVFVPEGMDHPPFLLIRTPYGIGNLDSDRLKAGIPEVTAEGFIIVMQDIRGRFQSEGQFVMVRPMGER